MRLLDLRLVVAIHYYGSPRAARRAFNITYSQLDKAIENIEQITGFKLFDRDTTSHVPNRNYVATPQGRTFLIAASRVIQAAKDVEDGAFSLTARRIGGGVHTPMTRYLSTEDVMALRLGIAPYPDRRRRLEAWLGITLFHHGNVSTAQFRAIHPLIKELCDTLASLDVTMRNLRKVTLPSATMPAEVVFSPS